MSADAQLLGPLHNSTSLLHAQRTMEAYRMRPVGGQVQGQRRQWLVSGSPVVIFKY